MMILLAGCGRIGFDGFAGGPDGAGDVGATDVMAGLRFWMPVDPGVSPARDVIGGRDPTCTGCGTVVDSTRGPVLELAMDCLEFGDAPEFAAPEFSIAVWFVYTGASSGTVFGKALDGANKPWNSWELWMRQSRDFDFKTTANNVYNTTLSTAPLARGDWYHAVAVLSATRKAFYLDGTLVEEELPDVPLEFAADPVRVGCDLDNGSLGQHFEGAVDDLRFYDRVLSEAEIVVLATP